MRARGVDSPAINALLEMALPIVRQHDLSLPAKPELTRARARPISQRWEGSRELDTQGRLAPVVRSQQRISKA